MLSISIVTYNSEQDIKNCLRSLKQQTVRNFEVIIIDNGSTDKTAEAAYLEYPQARFLSAGNNAGYGGGHNLGIHLAKNPWVMVLNPDVKLESDCIEELIKAKQKLGDSWAVIGPCLIRQKKEQIVFDTTGFDRTAYFEIFDRGRNQAYQSDLYQSGEVLGISGACALFKKQALETIAICRDDRVYPEYFDEDFFMYKEDVDLALRLDRAGWKAWHCAKAIGWHNRTGTDQKIGRTVNHLEQSVKHRPAMPQYVRYYSYRNHWFVLIKNAPLKNMPAIALYESGKLIYACIFDRQLLKGLKDVKKSFVPMLQRRYAK